MSPKSVVITGANRGIGLGLVQEFVKDKNIRHIIATARDVEKATDLKAISDPRVTALQLEVTCDKSMDTFVSKVEEIVGSDGLNLLVNNAGNAVDYPCKAKPNRALFAEQLNVNTTSVVILTQKLMPLLIKASSKVSGDQLSASRAAVVTISSGLASMTDFATGGHAPNAFAYRISKAAINMFGRALANDMKDDHILVASIGPGWVKTDMGGEKALLTVEQSTAELVASFNKLNNSHNGGFFQKDLTPKFKKMSPGSVVVTGANRGIGLGLVQQLVKDKNIRHIIATARDVEKATELKSIKDSRVHVLPLTVTCDKSLDTFVSKVGEIVGSDGLSLLINNAGVLLSYGTNTEPNRAVIAEQLDVNTTSVVLLTQKLLPLLKNAASKESGDQLSVSRAAVITISSGLGSITDNTSGSAQFPVLAYRMSKAAINMFGRTLAVDLKDDNVLVVNFCPGWVQTNLGGKNAALTVEQSTAELISSFNKLDNSHNGRFFMRNLKPYEF